MSFLDQCLALLRWKKLILFTTAVFALLSVAVAYLLPKSYISTAALFPPEEETFSLSSLSSLVSGTTLGGGGRSLPIWATPSDVYAAVLRSRSVREEVVRRLDLLRVYAAPDTDRALRALDRHTTIKVGSEGVVQIKVLDVDPKRAADIANAYVTLLDEVNREKRHSSARQARVFLEHRLEDNRRDLGQAEKSLRAIQESTGVMIPEDQLKSVIDATAEVQVQLMLKEVDLSVLGAQVGPAHPDRETLQRQVEVLRRRMHELEVGEQRASLTASPGTTTPGGLDLPLARYPGVQLAYLRALREVTVQETIYEFLNQEYERYRIQESRDTPTVQVLDRAVPATYKARPMRWLVCASMTGGALLLSILLALSFETLRNLRETDPERHARVRRLAGELGFGALVDRL